MNAEFGIKKLIRFAFRIPISAFLSSLMNKGLRGRPAVAYADIVDDDADAYGWLLTKSV